jgi:hypothetical protein
MFWPVVDNAVWLAIKAREATLSRLLMGEVSGCGGLRERRRG